MRVTINPAADQRNETNLPRIIPTGVQGLLDYAASDLNLPIPALLGLECSSSAALAPRLAGRSLQPRHRP